MKLLFIRFFTDLNSQIPHDSRPVCRDVVPKERQKMLIGACCDEIQNWMTNYPDGRIDFVWL